MKRKALLQSAFTLTAMLLLAAACTQDEFSDGSQGEPLPEGKYPLTFTATQGEPVASPQTRVSDFENKSSWASGDQIKVVVSEGDNDMTTTCTPDGSGNITGYDPQLYWKTTQPSKINAWYSNIAGQATVTNDFNTTSLNGQSAGLAYVLKAEEVTNASYKSENISLTFKHQLAKFRVKLYGDADRLNEAKVYFYGYAFCDNNQGTITTTTGNMKEYLPTQKIDGYYTAMLVPDDLTNNGDKKFVKIVLPNNATYYYNPNITLVRGKVYTYDVKEVNISKDLSNDGPITITDNREYHIKQSSATEATGNSITITGSPTVHLKDINISSSAGAALKIESGTPTIILEGTNILKSTAYGAAGLQLSGADANVKIQGTGTLNVTGAFQGGAGIGPYNGGTGGDIIIENCTITATATGSVGGAGIGSGIQGQCGNITIRNATVTAIGVNGGAGIGAGHGWEYGSKCGNILIEKSIIVATGSNCYGKWSAAIGTGFAGDSSSSCGDITIILQKGQTKEQFSANCTSSSSNGKIGKGDNNTSVGTITWKANDGTVIP